MGMQGEAGGEELGSGGEGGGGEAGCEGEEVHAPGLEPSS